MKKVNPEIKSMINDIVKSIMSIFNITISTSIVSNTIKKAYSKGQDKIEEEVDRNFLPNTEELDFLQQYSFDNIKDMNEEIKNDLRGEISRGLMNQESITKIKERVKKVIKTTENRAKMIARTETNRAQNAGHLNAAKKSDVLKYKQWDAHIDNRTSQTCKDLDGKRIPINQKFHWQGEEFNAPPAHVNCRSTLLFFRDKK